MKTPKFSKKELELLRDALDSHEYWQLTKPEDRNNGYSQVPDGDDPAIDACRALHDKIHGAITD